jgi:hypothetical protein
MHSLHVLIAFVVDGGNRNWPEAMISGQSRQYLARLSDTTRQTGQKTSQYGELIRHARHIARQGVVLWQSCSPHCRAQCSMSARCKTMEQNCDRVPRCRLICAMLAIFSIFWPCCQILGTAVGLLTRMAKYFDRMS